MEEKERYKVSVGSDYITICDYEENRIKALDNCGMQSLLNLQDNQIKAKEKEANTYAKEIVFLDNKIKLLERENQQLKQQLHDLPKKIVEEIRIELNNIVEVGDYFDTETDEETNLLKQSDIENILDAILEKFGDKNEKSNND